MRKGKSGECGLVHVSLFWCAIRDTITPLRRDKCNSIDRALGRNLPLDDIFHLLVLDHTQKKVY